MRSIPNFFSVQNAQNSLRFLNYNVGGLLSKLDNAVFMSYITSFDFICLTETHFSGHAFDSNIFKDFSVFIANAKKLSHHGRLSGGVVVLVKNTFSSFVERVKVDVDNTVVLRISKELFGTHKDVLFLSSYIPPYDSKFWNLSQHGYGIEVIEKCVLDLYELYNDFYLLLCGDFNSRTASENVSYTENELEEMLGREDNLFPRQSKDNEKNVFGEQLLELCNLYECVILNGLSSHGFDSGYTFISSSGSSTIDYFLMSCEMFSSICVKNVRIEDFVESDHLPVVLCIIMSAKSNGGLTNAEEHVTKERLVWDKDKEQNFKDVLQNENSQRQIDLATQKLGNDVNSALDIFVDCLTSASQCMFVKRGKPKKFANAPWFDQECMKAKRESRKKLKQFRLTNSADDRKEYVQVSREYRRMIKDKKKQFRRNKAESLASNVKNASTFWKELKSLGCEQKASISDNISVNDWFEHFKCVFSNDESDEQNDNQSFDNNIFDEPDHTLNQEITEEEVRNAVKNLKSGKSCGTDEIVSEMLKAGGHDVICFLTRLFNAIFDSGVYPSEWAKAIVIPIFKKGDVDQADNYRGVSLLSVISKCFTKVLNTRLYVWLEENSKISELQAGFRKNYSTTDQIFNLYAITQKCLNRKGQKLYVAFVDFRKAFDSVNHQKLLDVLRSEGIKGKFLSSLRSMYDSLISCVRINGEYTEFFDCPQGVRQGCVLSPSLFSLFINQLANQISEAGRHGIQLLPGLMELFLLLFADDVALLSTTIFGLQNQLNSLKLCCESLKLNVNKDKTKVMVFRKGGYLSKSEKWYFDGSELEIVNKYCYLGYTFTTMLSLKQGTDHLVTKGKKAVFFLCKAFQKCKEMTRDTFFKIFDAKVQSILLYSSEIWGLNRLENIERVHLQACKRFLGVPVKTPNKMIYGELGRFPLFVNSHIRCIKYWFRLLQMDEKRLPWQAYQMLVKLDENGKTCWATSVREILCQTGFYYVWLQQGVGDVSSFVRAFRRRLVDMFTQEWSQTIRDKDRYEIYRSFKAMLDCESYLSYIDIYCFRVAFTQVRLNVLPINNNLHRYSVLVNDRYCPLCNNCVEDEHHVISVCPLYADLRNRFLQKESTQPSKKLLEGSNRTLTLMVAKFVFHSMKRRKSYIDQ